MSKDGKTEKHKYSRRLFVKEFEKKNPENYFHLFLCPSVLKLERKPEELLSKQRNRTSSLLLIFTFLEDFQGTRYLVKINAVCLKVLMCNFQAGAKQSLGD
jgi:hypothetical protein